MSNFKIYNCDVMQGLAKIPNDSIDCVITSPPYNVGIDYDCWNDSLSLKDYYAWCKKWLSEVFRVLKTDGRFCLNHYLSCGNSEQRFSPLMDLNFLCVNEIGFKHHGLAVWEDTTLSKRTAWGSWLSANAPYVNSPFEGVLILYKQNWRKENEGKTTISKREFMNACSGVWKLGTDKARLTPATFPISLPETCIKLLTFEGETVLDCFMGSGSTGVSALKFNRNFIGIDISENYCKIAEERLKPFAEQQKLRVD